MQRGFSFSISIALATTMMAVGADASAPTIHTEATFNPAAFELPESVTMDDFGTIYLSMGGTVRRIAEGGSLEVLAVPPLPQGAFVGGLKVAENGDVYAVSGAFFSEPSAAFLWRIEQDGTVHQVAALDPTGFPDDLAIDDDGNVFVTDSFNGTIWKVAPDGEAGIWASSPLFLGRPDAPAVVIHDFGAVGVAFDKHKENLYVANLDEGAILKVAVSEDGSAGDISVFVADPDLVGADGIAFDKKGTLYAGVHTQDRIARIDKDGQIEILAQGGVLDAPSSLVFGTQGSDKKTLYVANFAINRALGTQPGVPHPALLSIDVEKGGLALP